MAVLFGPPFLAILFPLVVVMLVPFRIYIEAFSFSNLEALDAEDEPEDEETHWSV